MRIERVSRRHGLARGGGASAGLSIDPIGFLVTRSHLSAHIKAKACRQSLKKCRNWSRSWWIRRRKLFDVLLSDNWMMSAACAFDCGGLLIQAIFLTIRGKFKDQAIVRLPGSALWNNSPGLSFYFVGMGMYNCGPGCGWDQQALSSPTLH